MVVGRVGTARIGLGGCTEVLGGLQVAVVIRSNLPVPFGEAVSDESVALGELRVAVVIVREKVLDGSFDRFDRSRCLEADCIPFEGFIIAFQLSIGLWVNWGG